MTRPVTLLTGASAGIGMAFARLAARNGHDLVLVARRAEVLERLAAELTQQHGIEALVLPADLADPAAVAALPADVARHGKAVDILINNAGFGDHGRVGDLTLARQLDMLQVNVMALTALTHLFLPQLLERRGGILNVASTAAFQPGPGMSVYCASKAYVLHFTEGLHEEYARHGLRVTALCPGATATEFASVAHVEDSALFKMGAASPDNVAKAGWEALARNQAVVIPGAKNQASVFSTRLAPRAAVRKIAHSLLLSK